MDDKRRRQNEPPYTGSDPRFNARQNQGRGFSSSMSSSNERYRTSGPSPQAGRGAGGSGATGAYSGYYPEPQPSFGASLPTNNMQYQQNYQQDQRQAQGFTTYNADLMYNVAQPTAQGAVDYSSQQYPGRQPAAMQLLSDVAAPYFPNEPTGGPGAPGLQHHASSASSDVYQQNQQSSGDRAPMMQQGYQSQMALGGMSQAAPEIMEGEEFPVQGPAMEAAYTAYQTALKEIFGNIINGRLAAAGESLLGVSEWLLGHVGDLGLTVDEVTLHPDRIRLWGEFNTAWLSIFQKQKDMLESGHRIQHPQNIMTQEFINKMAKDLIRMCDTVEKHGLVDYQYGVAEEQIIMILSECLDVQEQVEGNPAQNPGLGRAPP